MLTKKDFLRVSTEQYEAALKHITMTQADHKALEFLFHSPNSTATAVDIAKCLKPQNPKPIVANWVVGRLGRKIAGHLNVKTRSYRNDRPAWFELIGPWTKDGWVMHPKLKQALVNLGWFADSLTDERIFS